MLSFFRHGPFLSVSYFSKYDIHFSILAYFFQVLSTLQVWLRSLRCWPFLRLSHSFKYGLFCKSGSIFKFYLAFKELALFPSVTHFFNFATATFLEV